ncbi:MAG: glutamyl-tRNA reductase [Abitibacteriaceae bacterium]|nr:glutamyl-tRNA reductase [Abditibacteriaceae bacterium]
MQLFLLGLNHKTAPVEVREQLALAPAQLPHALRGLREASGVREAAILSTCNRAEIYAVGPNDSLPRLEKFLQDFHHLPLAGLNPYLYQRYDADSARHLFQVACGVDSLVLGESQILGQVKTAFEAARTHGAISNILDELFRRAISCGKRARSETAIGRGALSVGSAAVELARQIFGPLSGHTVLILGAGKMSALTAQHLVASGARCVLVANRTHARAVELAEQFNQEKPIAEAVFWEEFPQRLAEADIVIASTQAPGFVVTVEQVAAAMKARRQRPLFLVDIAVPRDIEPGAHQLDNVFLYDIDDLQGVVNNNLAQRARELQQVESIIEAEVTDWAGWYRSREAQPIMAALAQHAAQIRDKEVAATLAQLPNLSPREQEIVRALAKSISGKLMHAPLRHLREAGEAGSADVEVLRRAFSLELAADHANGKSLNGAMAQETENSEGMAAEDDEAGDRA